ncbi:MAG TPA: hypothetical protein VFH70_07810 [Acidimicrobiales bacterium]|nr:hypothetical protein [Acidimicrobiales bacterium]
MRTTINLAPDTVAIVEDLRRRRGEDLSAVVNDLIRAGAAAKGRRPSPSISARRGWARASSTLRTWPKLSTSATANPDAGLRHPVGHGLTIYSADSDFARFAGKVRWRNPLTVRSADRRVEP